MRLYRALLYFLQIALHFSDDTIIRSTFKLYLQHQAWVEPFLLPSAEVEDRNCSSDSSTSADGSKYGSTSARCNYSLSVLLMMDEGIV